MFILNKLGNVQNDKKYLMKKSWPPGRRKVGVSKSIIWFGKGLECESEKLLDEYRLKRTGGINHHSPPV